MLKTMTICCLTAIGLMSMSTVISCNVPQLISFQGKLHDNVGNPLTGQHEITFSIYTMESGGTAIWSETITVNCENGLYSVILGQSSSLNLDFDGQHWLGVQVSGDDELTPRYPLTSVPTAYRAQVANRVSWTNLTDVPEGFADGTDNVGGGGPGGGWVDDGSNVYLEENTDKVGIGTTNPDAKLTVQMPSGTSRLPNTTGGLIIKDAMMNIGSQIDVRDESGNSRFTVAHDGRVGIGTTNPNARLEVVNAYSSGHAGYFENTSPFNFSNAVYGKVNGSGNAVKGYTTGYGHAGYFEVANANNEDNAIYAKTNGTGHAGYFAIENADNENPALHAETNALYGTAIYGYASGHVSRAVSGIVAGNGTGMGIAGYFQIDNANSTGHAVYAKTNGTSHAGYFQITNQNNQENAVLAQTNGEGSALYALQTGTGIAVKGIVTRGDGSHAAYFENSHPENHAYTLYVKNPSVLWGAYAGFFEGSAWATGCFVDGCGFSRIDHPVEPENKYLNHSVVGSPDMMNVYNGNVILDPRGEATVELPDYFETLNEEFRYQLTAIGTPGPDLYVSREISNNRFAIAGGRPGMKVSWQVTGIRRDAYARMNRIPVEEEKSIEKRGKYLHPRAYGLSEEMGIDFKAR